MFIRNLTRNGCDWLRGKKTRAPVWDVPSLHFFIMLPDQKLLLQVFLTRDVAELRAIISSKFQAAVDGKSTLVSSSIDGASFQFHVSGTLSPLDVVMLAQQALNYKAAGINRPLRATQAFFV